MIEMDKSLAYNSTDDDEVHLTLGAMVVEPENEHLLHLIMHSIAKEAQSEPIMAVQIKIMQLQVLAPATIVLKINAPATDIINLAFKRCMKKCGLEYDERFQSHVTLFKQNFKSKENEFPNTETIRNKAIKIEKCSEILESLTINCSLV